MPNPTHRPSDTWSPAYFLASVGAGGLAVTFFMYLLFWVDHPGNVVPTADDILAALSSGRALETGMIAVAAAGIALFGVLNLSLLVWNLRHVATFEMPRVDAPANARTQIMAMPLALAMSVNVLFILGLVFLPGLWSIIEYLFPAALVAFLSIGAIALRQLGRFVSDALVKGGFDCEANNSFAQLLPAFTFAMIGVGLAAPGSMSATPLTTGVSIVLSSFFFVASLTMAAIGLVLGVRSMLANGVATEQAPTLLMVLPLTTVLTILMLRQDHGLHAHFEAAGAAEATFMLLTQALSFEVLFAMFGMTVLAASGYVRRFVLGREISVGTYALICPGVALSVLLHFWINKGLVGVGLVDKFDAAYWVLSGLALGLQLAMLVLFAVLHRRHFWTAPERGAMAAAQTA